MNVISQSGTAFKAALILCATSLVVLAGCGQKPPDCTNAQTLDLVTQVVKQEIRSTSLAVATRGVPQDLRPHWEEVVARYVGPLKISVSEVVSNGYDSSSKKHSCEGKISLTTATADSAQVRSSFASQATAKGDGEFLVTVEQAGAIANAVVTDFVAFARADALRQSQQAAAPSPAPTVAPALSPANTATASGQDASTSRNDAAAESQQRQSVAAATQDADLGMPTSAAEYANGINVLRFTRSDQENLKFDYTSDAKGGTCTLSGIARIQGAIARTERGPGTSKCTITFRFAAAGLLEVSPVGECINQCPADQHELAGRFVRR